MATEQELWRILFPHKKVSTVSDFKMYDGHTEEAFLQATFQEFLVLWSSGAQASINIQCEETKAWVQMTSSLGSPKFPHSPRYTMPRTKIKTKATYAKHVGTVHKKVLDLVPAELKEAVLAVSKTRKSIIVTTKEPEADGLEVVGVQKQELAGGNEVNTIKEECVDADNMEVDANNIKEGAEAELESINEKVIEAKGLKSGRCPFCPNTKTQFQRSSRRLPLPGG